MAFDVVFPVIDEPPIRLSRGTALVLARRKRTVHTLLGLLCFDAPRITAG
jgi:hypothetical protein